MVTINFTLFVQLVLFLAFMWALDRLAFRPLLALIDSRDAEVEADRKAALQMQREVAESEEQYLARLSLTHRLANQQIAQARHKAQEDNYAEIVELRRQADAEIESIRNAYRDLIRAERVNFPKFSDGIAADMSKKLGLE